VGKVTTSGEQRKLTVWQIKFRQTSHVKIIKTILTVWQNLALMLFCIRKGKIDFAKSFDWG